MYIRQNRVKNRLGRLEGEFGQIPNQTINISDPVDGAQLSFSGPVHEIAQVQALVGLVSGAVGAARSNKIEDARKTLTAAKNLLPATGSQRDKASFLINKAEKFTNDKAASAGQGTSAGEVLTGVGSILSALAPAGMTALQTYNQSEIAKAALKAGGQAPQVQYVPVAASSSNTGVIIAVVGGIAAIGLVLVMMQKKK